MNKKTNQPLVVTTEHRGVFFGYGQPGDQPTIELTEARMCVKWQDTRGVLGLASSGPNKGCRISPAIPRITLRGVTAVMEVTEAAAKEWEKGHWV